MSFFLFQVLHDSKIVITFALAKQKSDAENFEIGALVQLVRIHACHAWGHGFESRTHRTKAFRIFREAFLLSPTAVISPGLLGLLVKIVDKIGAVSVYW